MKAIISDIKRFSIHDGDGIRTTVFFKGCPLKCVWCHNPECISFDAQIAHFKNNCINCGECVSVCKQKAHKIINGVHNFNYELCVLCGECEKACLGSAMKIYGKEYSVDELTDILLLDKDYYENSNGGVTLSGGECLSQYEFCISLMKKLKDNNIHIAVDTSGYTSKHVLDKISKYTDLFLYDIKAIDENIHIKCTGKSNKSILENLEYIDRFGIPIYIRIPYVPGFNNCEIDKISLFLKKFKNINRVEVLPYHSYASTRYDALNIENTLPKKLPSDEEIALANSKF